MKTIFITMADPMTVRNIFRTPFWPSFLEQNKDTQIVVLTLRDKKDYYTKTFGAPNVVFEHLDPRWKGRMASMLMSLARSSLGTHTNLWSKMRSYERGDSSWIATWSKRILTSIIGNSLLWKRLLRTLILRIPSASETTKLFEQYKPSLVISTYVASFDFDVPVNAEAKKRGIRFIGMTRSWDTLASHGMLRVVPNVLITQSHYLKECALRYQGFNETTTPIHVIGLPHYDAYQNVSSLIEPREAFFGRMGLDPNKKLIVYGAMGDFLFPNEGGIADVFERLIEEKKITAPAQAVYRAHPKFQSPLEKMNAMHHVKPDRGATYQGGSLRAFEMEAADEHHLINTFYHADIIATAASTFAMDAAVFDKPIICVGFDGVSTTVSYWESVQRFYDCYTHVEALLATKGARVANTPDELAADVNRYLADPSLEQEGRKKIIELLAAPFDGHASERLTTLLTDEVKKIN